jgi:hypothetical protein
VYRSSALYLKMKPKRFIESYSVILEAYFVKLLAMLGSSIFELVDFCMVVSGLPYHEVRRNAAYNECASATDPKLLPVMINLDPGNCFSFVGGE